MHNVYTDLSKHLKPGLQSWLLVWLHLKCRKEKILTYTTSSKFRFFLFFESLFECVRLYSQVRATCRGCLLTGCGSFGCGGDGGVACRARGGTEPVFQRSWFQISLALRTAFSLILETDTKLAVKHLTWKEKSDWTEAGLTSVCVSSSPSSSVRAASCLDLCSRRLTYRMGFDRASITSRRNTQKHIQSCQDWVEAFVDRKSGICLCIWPAWLTCSSSIN